MSRGRIQAGLTLIEVLVVMVVLLVGIFAAIHLFPIGFAVNQRVAEADTATRLASAEIDRYSTGAADLMDAIAPGWTDARGAFHFDPTVSPDDFTSAASAPAGSVLTDPYYFSNVNRIRHVVGESVRVPVSSSLGSVEGGVYMLGLGPIVLVPPTGGGTAYTGIAVHCGPMVRVEGLSPSDPSAASYLAGPSQYAIFYGDGTTGAQVLFQQEPFDRTFEVSYSYYDTSLASHSVAAQPLTVPANSTAWLPVPAPPVGWPPPDQQPTPAPLVPGSDTVTRTFNQIPLANAWSQDPYEYKVLYTNYLDSGGNQTNVNAGVLVFNPLGHDYQEQTATGTVPLAAHIDYDVLDWRILREEHTMPASSPYRVQLRSAVIKRIGDLQEDQTPYAGMFARAGVAGGSDPDLAIYNVATGAQVPTADYTVNYGTGAVTFTDAFGASSQAQTFRFLYEARGQWGLAIQKAAALYTQNTDPSTIKFDQYYLDPTANTAGQPLYMYFPICEAGKTFSLRQLTYTVHHASGTPPDENVTLRNLSFQIDPSPADFVTVGSIQMARATVATPAASTDTINWPGGALVPVVGVQGVSFRARAIWSGGVTINRNALPQDVVRWTWLHRDIDTSLSRVTR